jgi:hypothetical protein
MTEHTNRKTIWQGGIIGALVGLSFAIGFYFLVVSPENLRHQKEFGHLFVGLIIGSSFGVGISGASGSTRKLATQFLGSALGGGITVFIAALSWFTPGIGDWVHPQIDLSLQLFTMLGGALIGAVSGLLSSASSGILGAAFGWGCNRIGANNEYNTVVSAFGTSIGTALGWLPIMFLVFAMSFI